MYECNQYFYLEPQLSLSLKLFQYINRCTNIKKMITDTFLLIEGQNIFSTNLFHPIKEILLSFLILEKLGELKEHDFGDMN